MFTDEVLEVNYHSNWKLQHFIGASVPSFHQTKYKSRLGHPTLSYFQSFLRLMGSSVCETRQGRTETRQGRNETRQGRTKTRQGRTKTSQGRTKTRQSSEIMSSEIMSYEIMSYEITSYKITS